MSERSFFAADDDVRAAPSEHSVNAYSSSNSMQHQQRRGRARTANIGLGARAPSLWSQPDEHAESTPLLSAEVDIPVLDESGVSSGLESDTRVETGRVASPNVAPPRTGNKLGMFMGVFVPCILNTFGVIVFERLGWIISEAGVIQTMAMFGLGYGVIILSVLSLSAIATNGRMRGGGTYYLISRVLGPEFGGSIGVVFYIANVFGAAFYILGFADAFVQAFEGLVPDTRWMRFAYASGGLFVCICICLAGANMFARASLLILVVMASSMAVVLGSFMFRPKGDVSFPDPDPGAVFTSWNGTTFADNLRSNYRPKDAISYDFVHIFSILFPGLTGLLAGSNMSGDLKNPGSAIPKGTVLAGLTTFAVYSALVLGMAFTTSNQALFQYYFVMMEVCIYGRPVVAVGIFCAVISSALAAIVGAGRVIQALARDDLFPILRIFGKGSKNGDEPIYGMLLTWALVQAVLIVGDLNIIAPYITMFFLLSFLATNFACFFLRVTGAPNFRPSFKYFHWSTALLGAVSSMVIMFVVNPVVAGIAFFIVLFLIAFIRYRGPTEAIQARYSEWGNLSQGLIYHQVRKYLLMIDARKQHVKFWRPQVLLVVKSFGDQATPNEIQDQISLARFTNYLKKGGLYVLGTVVVGDSDNFRLAGTDDRSASAPPMSLRTAVGAFQHAFAEFTHAFQLKAFSEVTVAPSLRAGVQNLLVMSGIGGMKVNTFIMGFPERSRVGEDDVDMHAFSNSADTSSKLRHARRLPDDLSTKQQVAVELFPKSSDYSTVTRPRGIAEQAAYVEMMRDCISLGHNIVLARHFHKDPMLGAVPTRGTAAAQQGTHFAGGFVDIWLLPVSLLQSDDASSAESAHASETLSTLLLLGNILTSTAYWQKGMEIRVLSFVELAEDAISETARIKEMLFRYRIQASASVFSLSSWAKERLHSVGSFIEISPERKAVLSALADLDQDIYTEETHSDSDREVEDEMARRQRVLREKQAMHSQTLQMPEHERNSLLNELILSVSQNARLVMLPMPHPPAVDDDSDNADADSTDWLAAQEQLTRGLPPCMLVLGTRSLLTEQL